MQRHALAQGVHPQHGARGHLGGLSLATREAIRLLGAFGFDPVIIETVGVGNRSWRWRLSRIPTVVVLTRTWAMACR